MTNADRFKQVFDRYATEIWALPEKEFLKWLNAKTVDVNPVIKGKWIIGTTAKTFDILHFVADNAGLSTLEAIEKAYNMGVSEQEPILDKIRAEIESIEHYGTNNGHDFWLRTPDEIKKDVLIILDKYKAESEDEE